MKERREVLLVEAGAAYDKRVVSAPTDEGLLSERVIETLEAVLTIERILRRHYF